MPFWVVELVGILITEKFSIKTYLLDSFFLKTSN